MLSLCEILLGQRGQTHPKAMLTSLLGKRQKLQEELRSIEKQVHFSYFFIIMIFLYKCVRELR